MFQDDLLCGLDACFNRGIGVMNIYILVGQLEICEDHIGPVFQFGDFTWIDH